MPADALWTFAMGCNVWLSFFRSYDASTLRKLEVRYLLACYGLPFIPAFIYLFISTNGRSKVYGSAVVRLALSCTEDQTNCSTVVVLGFAEMGFPQGHNFLWPCLDRHFVHNRYLYTSWIGDTQLAEAVNIHGERSHHKRYQRVPSYRYYENV